MSNSGHAPPPAELAVALQRQIVAHFGENELQQLCFELELNYEDLEGGTRTDKARELIQHFERRNEVAKLVAACAKARPGVDWSFALAIAEVHTELPTAQPQTTAMPKPLVWLRGKRLPKSVLLLLGSVGTLLTGLAALLTWLWPLVASLLNPTSLPQPAATAVTATTGVSVATNTAPPPFFATPEFKVEQFHQGFYLLSDQPPETAGQLLRISRQPQTKGHTKPRRADDAVWLLVCPLDSAATNAACRATRLGLAEDGGWDEVVRLFAQEDMCRDFEIRIWLVGETSDKALNQLAGARFPQNAVASITPRSVDTHKVRISQNNDDKPLDCADSLPTSARA